HAAAANTELYVVDRAGYPAPTGTPGELWIGGRGVAHGYIDRPALSAEKFIPDPFSGEPGARVYRTGDLVRYRRDGALEFLGRLDFQVKLRGYRIELGEVETVLETHRSVAQAVAMAQGVGDSQALVAYLVPADGAGSPAESALREHLAKSLPAYMVPSHFVTLESFPLTANGKVDRKALPKPGVSRKADAFVAPHGRVEQQVAAIWGEALGLESVGANDNFFDLGGHSLLMSQVHGRINETFGREIPLVKMLELPTISALARYLTDSDASGSAAARGKDRAQRQREARRRRRRVPA
ncbi:MAG: phosphopantetheine-binding protein, partial [Acidobacteriota bacterium]